MELAYPENLTRDASPPEWPHSGRNGISTSDEGVEPKVHQSEHLALSLESRILPMPHEQIPPLPDVFTFVQGRNQTKRRVIVACINCRKRKIRCDIATFQSSSCSYCARMGMDCEVRRDGQREEPPKEMSASTAIPPRKSIFSSSSRKPRSKRGSMVLRERDANARSDTQSIGSRQSHKSFMSSISIGSIKSAISCRSVCSGKSIISQRSRKSLKSLASWKSSRSFQSLGTYDSSGSSNGGRSQSAYGQSTEAIHNWDDGWKSSQFPEPQPVYTHLSLICGRPDQFHDTETIEPPFTELSLQYAVDIPRMKAVLRAAETGNDQLIDFLLSSSLADADQPPIPGGTVASSTPMLAAIGRENIKVIEALLKQKNFDPTRQFWGLTYYEIAEKRRGSVWEDEVRILKQAFNYAYEHQNRNLNNIENARTSSLIKPLRLPVRPTPTAQFRTIRRTVSSLDVPASTNQPRCRSAGPQGHSKTIDMNMAHLGPLKNSMHSGDLPISPTLITNSNSHEDHGAIGIPTNNDLLMGYSRENDQVSEGYRAPTLPNPDLMNDLSTPQTPASSARNTSEITSPLTIPSQGESELSDFSMNESSEDSHCEEESSFVQRAERRRVLLRYLMDMVYSTYTRLVTSGAMEDGETGPSNAPRGDSSSASPSNNQQNKGHNTKGKRPLPKGDGNNGGEEGDDQQQPKRRKSTTHNDGINSAERFACPYYQRNRYRRLPRNYLLKGACYGPGFHSVHRVKEHLYRAHRLPPCCSRCNVTFDSDISLEKHTRQDRPCELTPKQLREGIDPTTEKLLRIRNKEFNSKTEEDKWRHVYTVLFPADDPVDLPSPYYGNYLEPSSVESSPELKPTAKSYDEFLQRELFRRIYRVLENKIDEALDSAERNVADALKSQLEGIIRDVQTELYEEFQSSIKQKQVIDGTNEISAHVPISGIDPMSLLEDVFPLGPFSPPWSALSLEHQQEASSSSIPQLAYRLEDISNIRFDLLSNPVETSQNHDFGTVTSVPFTVKATYDYISNHAEDLPFRLGQIITVTGEEEIDWYNGEYVDDFGVKKEGIFPRNLVERYPPPVPPRPMRGHKGNTGSVATTFPSSFPPYYTA